MGKEGRGKDLPPPGIDADRDAAMTEAVVETSTPTDLSPDQVEVEPAQTANTPDTLSTTVPASGSAAAVPGSRSSELPKADAQNASSR